MCAVWESLVWFWGSECVVCGTVWSGFMGVSVCCVWDSLERVCGCEYAAGGFVVCMCVVCVCGVWVSLYELALCGCE